MASKHHKPEEIVAKLRQVEVLVPLHSGFDGLSVSGIEHGQIGVVHLDSDAPSRAGLA